MSLIESYWEDLDDRLVKLIECGFTSLPSLNCFNLKTVAANISDDMAGRTWMELGPSHEAFLEEIKISERLVGRLYEIAQDHLGYRGKISNQYHIARRIEPGNSTEAYRAHFDSHLFTVVFPIKIPRPKNHGAVGELVFFPEARKRPKNEIQNLFQKAYYKKFASEKGINTFAAANSIKIEAFQDFCPLIFMGDTTLHTNKELSNDCSGYRLTLLAHFFDPTPHFGVGNLLRVLRSR